MPKAFDPYHKWLGISPKDQPPHHYRLLAIDVFEADLDVIADAAEQRIAHVRQYQLGKRSDLSQKVLNEIAAAKACLLDPNKKAEYDEQLRMKLNTPAAPPPVATPKPTAAPPAPRDTGPAATVERVAAATRQPRARKLRWPMVAGIAVGVLSCIVVAALLLTGRPEKASTENENSLAEREASQEKAVAEEIEEPEREKPEEKVPADTEEPQPKQEEEQLKQALAEAQEFEQFTEVAKQALELASQADSLEESEFVQRITDQAQSAVSRAATLLKEARDTAKTQEEFSSVEERARELAGLAEKSDQGELVQQLEDLAENAARETKANEQAKGLADAQTPAECCKVAAQSRELAGKAKEAGEGELAGRATELARSAVTKAEKLLDELKAPGEIAEQTLELGRLAKEVGELELGRRVTIKGLSAAREGDRADLEKEFVKLYNELNRLGAEESDAEAPATKPTSSTDDRGAAGTVKSEVAGPPKLLKISEVQGSSPWLSQDGLTIYWEKDLEKGGAIWTAQRESPDSYFTDKKELFPGRYPTVTADGLEMVFLAKWNEKPSFQVATRISMDGSFSGAKEIRELRDVQRPISPCLSPNGLMLYFNRGGGATKIPMEIVVCSRGGREAPWSMPRPLPIRLAGIEKGVLTGAYVNSSGLSMYCAIEGREKQVKGDNLMLWTRRSKDAPFASFKYLRFDGSMQMQCLAPRYVAATNELFVNRVVAPSQFEIWVLKNFIPPRFAE